MKIYESMKSIGFLILAFLVLQVTYAQKNGSTVSRNELKYPETRKSNKVDTYFGTAVPDPYDWLEDDRSEETKQWVEAQNKVTFDYLRNIPYRDKIKARIKEIFNYEKYSVPGKEAGMYFFTKNDGLQNQSVLYMQKDLNATPELLLDPNKLSSDGTVALAAMSVSKDGKYLAYGTAGGGSDWNEFYVMEINGSKKLNDHLKWIKFSGISWYKNGFFYSRFPQPEGSALSSENEYQKIYYHQIGTDQSQDKLVYEDLKNPKIYYGAGTTEDERYLVITGSKGTHGNALYVRDLAAGENSELIPLVTDYENDHAVVDNLDDRLLIYTNLNAPRYRIVSVDPKDPKNWKDVIPQTDEVLEGATLVGGRIFARYMKDASSVVKVFDENGKFLHEVKLPAIGTADGFYGKREDKETFYSFTSFTYPTVIYKYDIATNTSEVFKKPDVKFNPSDYVVKQVFYPSKDKTKIPMFIVHKKGIQLNGKNPAYLYGYGGFNISLTPSFSASRIAFLENGGVMAIANLRGGGEYGEDWHKAGMLLKKQNVFNDFISAAEYLIRQKYTSSSKLAIAGGSNGGLLVGACMTQRPDLFKVALPAVGVMDMLKYHKFTIGWGWAVEFGSSDDEQQFKNLYKYSPLHNIKAGVSYPATLVTTADHDDRVVPAHSFKFISELQAKHKGVNPVLIRIETKAGHGAGKPTDKQIEEAADVWSFVFYNTNTQVKY